MREGDSELTMVAGFNSKEESKKCGFTNCYGKATLDSNQHLVCESQPYISHT